MLLFAYSGSFETLKSCCDLVDCCISSASLHFFSQRAARVTTAGAGLLGYYVHLTGVKRRLRFLLRMSCGGGSFEIVKIGDCGLLHFTLSGP